MQLSKTHCHLAVKALLAIVMLAALAGVAGSQIAPHVPLQTVLLNCAIGAAVLFAALVFVAILIVDLQPIHLATRRHRC